MPALRFQNHPQIHSLVTDQIARRDCILGIDPGLERTGYAVLGQARNAVVDAGVIRTTTTRSLSFRLTELADGLDEVLTEHVVGLIAVESLYAHYRHPRTAILMGHARGVILLAAARRSIEVLNLPATQIKKTVTGNGRAGKSQIQRAIMGALGLTRIPEPADVADAMAAALCAAMARQLGLESRGGP